MKFDLVDQVLEQDEKSLTSIKNVTSAEEYLQDHFPSFPILPGVMMLECLVQAARKYLELQGIHGCYVLGKVSNAKYGNMVRPGEQLRVSVNLFKQDGENYVFKGEGRVNGSTAIAGRFTLRKMRLDAPMETGA